MEAAFGGILDASTRVTLRVKAADAERRATTAEHRSTELEMRHRVHGALMPEPAPEPSVLSHLVDELQRENVKLQARVLQHSLAENGEWVDATVQLVGQLRRENADLHEQTITWKPPEQIRQREQACRRKRKSPDHKDLAIFIECPQSKQQHEQSW